MTASGDAAEVTNNHEPVFVPGAQVMTSAIVRVMGRVLFVAAFLIGIVAGPAFAQTTATYHLHQEASNVSGVNRALTGNPDAASATLLSGNLGNQSAGEYLIKSFITDAGSPGVAGTIPTQTTLTFTVHMRKTATGGVFYPKMRVQLNSAIGALVCQASGSTALDTTVRSYAISCVTTANVTLVASDRLYLWVGTQIATAAGGGNIKGDLRIEGTPGGNYDSQMTVPLPTPTISSVNPASGTVGQTVTISGANFGATQGSSTVRFNGTTATPTAWTATSITTTVPSSAGSGPVVVTVGGWPSNGVSFTVATPPNITSLSPASGAIGQTVMIAGSNFGSTQGTSTVTFSGTPANATSWNATSITTTVPSGAGTGQVIVNVGGLASNGATFTVLTAPSITSLTPSSGAVGQTVTIAGTNFGPTQGGSSIAFNGTAASPTNWSATSITTSVPFGATTGSVVVTVTGLPSNGASFTVLTPPSITSLSLTSGSVGQTVTISGSNFGATQGGSAVTFNGTTATATSWSAGSITTTVPSGATTGSVVVTVAGLASNGVTFTVNSGAPSSEDVSYYHTDGLGSVRIVTDASGVIVERYDYLPFGEQWPAPSGTQPRRFAGKERDSETAFDYSGARYYASQIGRFTTVDPALAVRFEDPQSWNRYSYVNNRPLRFVDPSGLWPTEIHNDLIRAAFPGLSAAELDTLTSASFWSDNSQYTKDNVRHSLRASSDVDGPTARQQTKAFVDKQVQLATNLQGGKGGTRVLNSKALFQFGYALHAVMDSTSPAHRDENGNPASFEWAHFFAHLDRESSITKQQFNDTLSLMRLVFEQAFGVAQLHRAVPKPLACVQTFDASGASEKACQ